MIQGRKFFMIGNMKISTAFIIYEMMKVNIVIFLEYNFLTNTKCMIFFSNKKRTIELLTFPNFVRKNHCPRRFCFKI